MPYYRVTIALKYRKPAIGIRHYDNPSIDAVINIVRVRAPESYGDAVVYVEAAMLSNHCTAVKLYRENRYVKEKKNMWVIHQKKE